MSLEYPGAEPSRDAAGEPPPSTTDLPSDAAQLADAELQEKYRREYLTQQRRLACPGCGESPFDG